MSKLIQEVTVWGGSNAGSTQDKDLLNSLRRMEKILHTAMRTSVFLSSFSISDVVVRRAYKSIGGIIDAMEKSPAVDKDLRAVKMMHRATRLLNDTSILTDDPQAAAEAFNLYFKGLVLLIKKIPSFPIGGAEEIYIRKAAREFNKTQIVDADDDV
jgi:hypothetical protein